MRWWSYQAQLAQISEPDLVVTAEGRILCLDLVKVCDCISPVSSLVVEHAEEPMP